MKKVIIAVIVLVLIGGAYWLGTKKEESSEVSGTQEVTSTDTAKFIPFYVASVDIAQQKIQASDVTSGNFTIDASQATIYQYTNDPSCTVSCSQPHSLVNIDSNVKAGQRGGYEAKGAWAKVNGQNIFKASEIRWQ
jgi:Flp pilus assembly protein CpaB